MGRQNLFFMVSLRRPQARGLRLMRGYSEPMKEKKNGPDFLNQVLEIWIKMACLSNHVGMATSGLRDKVLQAKSAHVFKTWIEAIFQVAQRTNPEAMITYQHTPPISGGTSRKQQLWHEFMLTCKKGSEEIKLVIAVDTFGLFTTEVTRAEAPQVTEAEVPPPMAIEAMVPVVTTAGGGPEPWPG